MRLRSRIEDFRIDSDLFSESVGGPESQKRVQAALEHGFQTRNPEIAFGQLLGDMTYRAGASDSGGEPRQ